MKNSKSKYGKIVDGKILQYNGKIYEIRYITKSCLVLKTNKLYGRYGDQFDLKNIR